MASLVTRNPINGGVFTQLFIAPIRVRDEAMNLGLWPAVYCYLYYGRKKAGGVAVER
jgi:hypothetical protein